MSRYNRKARKNNTILDLFSGHDTAQKRWRENWGTAVAVGMWFIGVVAYLFTSNLGGQIGVTLGIVIGVFAMVMPETTWRLAGDGLYFSGILSLPSTILSLGSVGAVIGIIASFAARRGRPVTRWSKKTVARGKYYLETGDIDKGFALADRVLRFGAADFSGGYQLRGDACLEKGDKYKAVEEYTKAIRLKPDWVGGYCDRCGAYLIMGDCHKAIVDSTEAVRFGSASKASSKPRRVLRSVGYLYRGKAYSLKGDLDKAVADFSEVLRREPLNGFFFGCRGDVYSAKGDFDKAVADYTEAIRFGPNRAKWRFFRGVAYEKIGNVDLAAADFNAVIRMEPNSEEAAPARDALKRLDVDKIATSGNPAYAPKPCERKSKALKDLEEFLRNGREYILQYF
jgi:tetratricopeptide (TPR) repeat protein